MNKYTPILQQYVGDSQFDLEQLCGRAGVLALTLIDQTGQRIKLSFDTYMAYRKLDEGDALLTIAHIKKTAGTGKYFYRVEDSDFVTWFSKERCDPHVLQKFIHFSVAAINDIVDVISLNEPVVEVY